MKSHKEYAAIVILNLILSMTAVYLSPRFDPVTLAAFVLINILLFVLLKLNDTRKKKETERAIEEIFELLHSAEAGREVFQTADDEFGKLKDEIIKIIAENRIVAGKSKENQQILREYTEDIAHQIKTPLTGILLMTDLLGEDRENAGQYVDYIRNSIKRLHLLTEILLKMAALDSGTVDMKKERVDAGELLEDIKADIETYFTKEGVSIPVYGENFTLVCDRQWTYEALFNIVKNGIEAACENGVEIHLKETKIFRSILVKDFGKGLSGEMLRKACKRFCRQNPKSRGYGIGLPMARTIMEKQGGELLYCKGKGENYFELRFYK